MKNNDNLSEAEFTQLIQLLDRHVRTDFDQWALWKFNTPHSKIFVEISLAPRDEGSEEMYFDLNHLLKKD